MLKVTRSISIDEDEISEVFIRSSGPGGQNVNKVATAVQLRFDVANSPSLPDDVRERLIRLAGKRMTDSGELVIDARQFRTQLKNRADARERLAELIRRAAVRPKPRKRTKPTRASKERRLDGKRRRSQTKKRRGRVSSSDE
jgi:ribosome-associated protein